MSENMKINWGALAPHIKTSVTHRLSVAVGYLLLVHASVAKGAKSEKQNRHLEL